MAVLLRVLVAALLVLVTASPAAAQEPPPPPVPFTTPDTSACPYATTPPPAVDASEVPAPGEPAPEPLPRPERPVGGDALGACGAVQVGGTAPLPDGISAAAWVVADADTGQVLAAKDAHGLHRPASTMKVFTALVALRALPLDTVLTATQADADVEGSGVGVGAGGQYTVRELLLGALLQSGNDAVNVLAGALGGVPATVAAVNTLAAELGARDTRAGTPSGLDAPGTSTSAYDLALAFRAALAQPGFVELAGTRTLAFPGFGGRPGFQVDNDNALLAQYPGTIAAKNGFTDDARQTLVGAAERDGRRLVVSLVRGERTPLLPWQQAAALLDWGFAAPADADGVGVLVEPGSTAPAAGTTTPAPTAAPPAAAGSSGDAAAAPAPPDGRGRSASQLLGTAVLALVSALVLLLGLVALDARRRR